ncbi:hypothetical protein ACIZ62_12750 [Acetobacterium carbinolicum]|uniref:hypothetical protein n=1 Tax=Acetobacterium carbinolicum TaxID=52690 RepID=UPI0039BED2FC
MRRFIQNKLLDMVLYKDEILDYLCLTFSNLINKFISLTGKNKASIIVFTLYIFVNSFSIGWTDWQIDKFTSEAETSYYYHTNTNEETYQKAEIYNDVKPLLSIKLNYIIAFIQLWVNLVASIITSIISACIFIFAKKTSENSAMLSCAGICLVLNVLMIIFEINGFSSYNKAFNLMLIS